MHHQRLRKMLIALKCFFFKQWGHVRPTCSFIRTHLEETPVPWGFLVCWVSNHHIKTSQFIVFLRLWCPGWRMQINSRLMQYNTDFRLRHFVHKAMASASLMHASKKMQTLFWNYISKWFCWFYSSTMTNCYYKDKLLPSNIQPTSTDYSHTPWLTITNDNCIIVCFF